MQCLQVFFKDFAQPYFEDCSPGVFFVVMRSVAGYVTNGNRERERKGGKRG